jgi:predicted helicase
LAAASPARPRFDGPEFHRLSFGEAVERGLLTDYKVMLLTVDQSVIASRLQQELAGVSGELMLDDAFKIVGCWNGLAKRAGTAARSAVRIELAIFVSFCGHFSAIVVAGLLALTDRVHVGR